MGKKKDPTAGIGKLYTFTVRRSRTIGGSGSMWMGTCFEFPSLSYEAGSRSAALSGIKRIVAKQPFAQAAKSVQTKRKVNRVVFVIDRSSSMQGVMATAKDEFKKSIATLLEESKRTGQETYVSVVSFADGVTRDLMHTPVAFVNADQLHGTFRAQGMTALYNGISQAVSVLEMTATASAHRMGVANTFAPPVAADEDVAYLVVGLTDGGENASRGIDGRALGAKIQTLQKTDLWTFTFLVPPGDRQTTANALNIPIGNIAEWDATNDAGVRDAGRRTQSAITNYTTVRASGKTSTQSFYTDLSKLKPTVVRQKLVDISARVKVWDVKAEQEIRPFCEEKSGKPFLKGAAFYALTKTEKKVQPNKKILIVEKGKTAVYSGDDARKMLGLPTDRDVKLVPGNHGNWDVFIQSTSVNRPLVRGTKVVYDPAVGVPFKEGPSAPQVRARRKR